MCDYKDMEELEDSIDEAVAGGWLEWIGDEGELKINRDGREYALEMIKESRYVSPVSSKLFFSNHFSRVFVFLAPKKIRNQLCKKNQAKDCTR